MSEPTVLGEFLRVRRERLHPSDVGLGTLGRRRVAGLRREEVAAIAGVSADYYTRLEQGRNQHPSQQVTDALARALLLDHDATVHLHRLSRLAPPPEAAAPPVERVPPTVMMLLKSFDRVPAFVTGRRLDVLASNALAQALGPMHVVGTNLLRSVFLDPRAPELHPDRTAFGARIVATLRATVGGRDGDAELEHLIDELSTGSEEFRRLWAQHLVRGRGNGKKAFSLPGAGEVELEYHTFTVNGAEAAGQTLVAYCVAAGSPTDDLLSSLRTPGAGATPR